MQSTLRTIKEASELLKLTEQQIRNLCRAGKLQSQKLGSAWVIESAVLEHFKSSHSCGDAENQIGSTVQLNGKPIALSFFSGAMGMDIGLERAGFDILLCCEVDKACRKTIARNHPERALIGDIRNYESEEIRSAAGLSVDQEIDLVVGGPPCQAFSTAGKRKGLGDARGNLLIRFLELIIDLSPKFAVIENVRGILSASMAEEDYPNLGGVSIPRYPQVAGGVLRYVIDRLESAGYGVNFNLYNAANFGTPQQRERVIIIASRDGQVVPDLKPTHSSNNQFDLPTWINLREALAGLEHKDHTYLKFPEKRLRYYRMLKPGQNWRDLDVDLQKEALGQSYYSGGGKTGFFRRLSWDKPSPTLVTHPAMPATDLAHPESDRPLSIEEYMRIQQFPDDWKFEGTLVEKYRQIGNAVPVGLGHAIGKHLMELRSGNWPKTPLSFKYSRYSRTDKKSWEVLWEKSMSSSKQASLF